MEMKIAGRKTEHGESSRQIALIYSIREARKRDANRYWRTSFGAGMAELKRFYRPHDISKIISEYSQATGIRQPTVLEIGTGPGNAAAELKREKGDSIRLIATGVRWLREWDLPAKNGVKFLVLHSQNMSRKIKPESIDIIHSNLGFAHSSHLDTAFREVGKVLKGGGLFLFTAEHDVLPGGAPDNFELLHKSWKVVTKPDEDDITMTVKKTIHTFLLMKRPRTAE
ncbi:Methyltransferase domain protein [uncultured archaeon]|nr:Methyltransferase domain protein [uncultured archaeon]